MTTTLLIGGGGREHALAVSINASPLLGTLYVAPGNPGIAKIAECVALDIANHNEVIDFAQKAKVDLVVVGPEAPLVNGLADALEAAGINCFGPKAQAARLEGSKEFARDFCRRHNIPQPNYKSFDEANAAKAYVAGRFKDGAAVIKADGLAAGKGVVVADNKDQAFAAIDMILGGDGFGGGSLVVEDRIYGIEASLFAVVDGTEAVLIGSAQDHKRAYDGDTGPNTGGMGAISPAPALTDGLLKEAWDNIVLKTAKGMAEEGHPYRGFLYVGLMLTNNGVQVIEFNCRFGDPEAEAILPRLESDLLEALKAATCGKLGEINFKFTAKVAVTVVMVNGGYPGEYTKGGIINGLDNEQSDAIVFHAGTSLTDDGKITATGGRVLAVTALGDNKKDARTRAYTRVNSITWPQVFFRKDIADI
jgi:phosphoribosylamine--glycine ligase